MLVNLTYFKPSGKYYSSADYQTEPQELYRIWQEVAVKMEGRRLPGLVGGHSDYIVMVDVPNHPHRHPHLLLPGQPLEVKEPVLPTIPELPEVKPDIRGVKTVMRAIGLKPKTGTDAPDWFNVFRDNYYGIVVQVPTDKMRLAYEALRRAGFTYVRFGDGFNNIYC